MSDKIKLECKWTRTDQQLEVALSLLNGLDKEIYLFTPITEYRGEALVPLQQRVYITWEAGDKVHLTKRLWPVPDDIDVYMPEVPLLTQVKAGAKWEEKLVLPFPLLVNYPYRQEAKGQTHQSKAALFSLGYVVGGKPDLKVELAFEKPYPCYKLSYGAGIQNQVLVQSVPGTVAVPVQE